ncbi:MAG: hypothetical protein P4L39_03750 [Humidesulfovibrio sp.]|nr:hypothetical protein [Humidesulfovibrio sp.]
MELAVAVSEEAGFLRFTLSGAFPASLPEAIDAYAGMYARAVGSGVFRYLLDLRGLCQRMSIPEIFEFATAVCPEEEDQTRTATLDSPSNMVAARFFENLMHSRGRTYRLFTCEPEAVEWLLSEKS